MRLEDYQKAAQCFEKVVSDYPMYRRCWYALTMVGSTYDQMKQKDLISAEQADPKIKAAYQQLLEVYPECEAAKDVALKFGWLNFNKGQWSDAARYWQWYLDKYPNEENMPNLSNMLYALGRAYEETNQPDKAIQAYEKLLTILPIDDPRAVQVQTKLDNLK